MKFILLIMCAYASINRENKKIVSIINKQRANFQLKPIFYNNILDKQLADIKEYTNKDEWFYESGNQSSSFIIDGQIRTNDLKGSYLPGINYLFRDTYFNKVFPIMKFRAIDQINCFDFNKCPFELCLKRKPITIDKKPCSYAYAYMPKLLNKTLESIAILRLNTRGRYVPNNSRQMRSFWVYATYTKIDMIPIIPNKNRCHYIRPVAFSNSMSKTSNLEECKEWCFYDSLCNYAYYNKCICTKITSMELSDNYKLSKNDISITFKKITAPAIRFYGQKCINYHNKNKCNKNKECSWNKGPIPYNRERFGSGGNFCGRVRCISD